MSLPGTLRAQQIAGSPGSWAISALQTTLFAGGIVNAATLTSDIAPGGIVSIFGAGLAGSSVTVNGESAKVLAALPFQINAQVPVDIPSGTATFAVSSAAGSATVQAAISTVAPEIFTIAANQAAITNQDNTLNTAANPAARGTSIVIYSTGFGAVGSSGGLNPAKTPVSVVIGSTRAHSSVRGTHARSRGTLSGERRCAGDAFSRPFSTDLFKTRKRGKRSRDGCDSVMEASVQGLRFSIRGEFVSVPCSRLTCGCRACSNRRTPVGEPGVGFGAQLPLYA